MKSIIPAFLLILSLFVSNSLKAQHLMGAELTYTYVSEDVYDLNLVIYRDCKSPFTLDPSYSLSYNSVSLNKFNVNVKMNFVSSDNISAACPAELSYCEGGNQPGIERTFLKGRVTLPGKAPDWVFSFLDCDRANEIDGFFINTFDLTKGRCLSVQALINNTLSVGANSSPYFTNTPSFYLCENQQATVDNGTLEQNKDSLVFRSITPRISDSQTMTYATGYSATRPLSISGSFELNASSGLFRFTPNQLKQRTAVALRVEEYRNGQLVGYVTRDYQHLVQICNNQLPVLSGINKTSDVVIEVCAKQPVTFRVYGSDPQNQKVILSWNGALASSGAQFIVHTTPDGLESALAGNSAQDSIFADESIGYFTWTPDYSHIGNNFFTVTVTDSACPVRLTRSLTYNVRVKTSPFVALPGDFVVRCDTDYVVKPVISGGISPYTYLWTPSNITTDTAVLSLGLHTLQVTAANGCFSQESIRLLGLQAAFGIDTSCVNSPIIFKDSSVSLDGQITKWEWDFGDGAKATVKNPTHTYAQAGFYNVELTVTDSKGCVDKMKRRILVMRRPEISYTITDSCSESIGLLDTMKVDKNSTWLYITSIIYYLERPNEKLDNTNYTPEVTFGLTGDISFDNRPAKIIYESSPPQSQDANYFNYNYIFLNGGPAYADTGKYHFQHHLRSVYNEMLLDGKIDMYVCPSAPFTDTVNVFEKPDFDILSEEFFLNCSKNDTLVKTELKSTLNAPFKYNWTTAGGTILGATDRDSVLIKGAGNYVLEVENSKGCKEKKELNIKRSLTSGITFTPYCRAGQQVVFDYSKASVSEWGIQSVKWDFGNGTPVVTGFDTAVVAPYTKDSLYIVKLVLTDSTGCVDSASTVVWRTLPDFNNFKVLNEEKGTVADTICYGEIVLGIAPSPSPLIQNINNTDWDFGDLNPTRTVPAQPNFSPPFDARHVYVTGKNGYKIKLTTNYNYQIQATGELMGCDYKHEHNIYAWDSINFTTSLTQQQFRYCADSLTTFDAIKVSGESPILKYKWDFYYRRPASINDKVSTLPAPRTGDELIRTVDKKSDTITFRNAALDNELWYVFELEDVKGCKFQNIMPFRNQRIPPPDFDAYKLCANEETEFKFNQIINDGFYRFSIREDTTMWLVNDSVFAYNAGTKQRKFDTAGEYRIKLIVMNFDTCQNFIVKPITIKPYPNAKFTVEPVCFGDTSFFVDGSTPADSIKTKILNYVWTSVPVNNHPGFVTETSEKTLSYVFPAPQIYPVRLEVKDSNGCTDTTDLQDARVIPDPVPDFNINRDDLFAFYNIPIFDLTQFPQAEGEKWSWNFGDGDDPLIYEDAQNPIFHTYDSVGIYYVTLTAENQYGCTSSVTKKVDLFPYLLAPTAFSPNDDNLHDRLNLMHKGIDRLDEFKIYNRWGELIFDACPVLDAPCSSWDGTINGSPQPNGVYTVFAVGSVNRQGYNAKYSYRGKVTIVR